MTLSHSRAARRTDDSGGGANAAGSSGYTIAMITHETPGDTFRLLKLGGTALDKKRAEVGLDELTTQMAGGDELAELSHELGR